MSIMNKQMQGLINNFRQTLPRLYQQTHRRPEGQQRPHIKALIQKWTTWVKSRVDRPLTCSPLVLLLILICHNVCGSTILSLGGKHKGDTFGPFQASRINRTSCCYNVTSTVIARTNASTVVRTLGAYGLAIRLAPGTVVNTRDVGTLSARYICTTGTDGTCSGTVNPSTTALSAGDDSANVYIVVVDPAKFPTPGSDVKTATAAYQLISVGSSPPTGDFTSTTSNLSSNNQNAYYYVGDGIFILHNAPPPTCNVTTPGTINFGNAIEVPKDPAAGKATNPGNGLTYEDGNFAVSCSGGTDNVAHAAILSLSGQPATVPGALADTQPYLLGTSLHNWFIVGRNTTDGGTPGNSTCNNFVSTSPGAVWTRVDGNPVASWAIGTSGSLDQQTYDVNWVLCYAALTSSASSGTAAPSTGAGSASVTATVTVQ